MGNTSLARALRTAPCVHPAEPFRENAMGSTGDACRMIIRQYNFPDTYDESLDSLMSCDHDHIANFNQAHVENCFRKYTGYTDNYAFEWFRSANHGCILRFLVDILNANPKVLWTGYRIMGTVHQRNGSSVWTLELFAKHPKSLTEVYTGEKAPNILSRKRYE